MVTPEALQSLNLPNLEQLAKELLTPGADAMIVVSHDGEEVEPRNLGLLPLASAASKDGLTRAYRVTTARVLHTDRLTRLVEIARQSTRVIIDVVDVDALVNALDDKPSVSSRYFPEPDDLDELIEGGQTTQRQVDRMLKTTARLEALGDRTRLLIQTACLLLILVLPLHLTPRGAVWTGVLGLAGYAGLFMLGQYIRTTFGRSGSPPSLSSADAILPAPTAQERARLFTLQQLGSTAQNANIQLLRLVWILRLLFAWGLFVFVAVFALTYTLLWGLYPTTCKAGNCEGAFAAIDAATLGDFFFISIQGAFFNVAGTHAATSTWSRAILAMQFVASALFLAYFSRVFGFGRVLFPGADRDAPEAPPAGSGGD